MDLLLTTMDRLHKQLDDFTTQLYIAFAFGDGSGLVPSIRIEQRPAGPELLLHHCIAFCAEGDPDISELRFSAGVAVTSAGWVVEALVDVDLDQPRGEFGAGLHTLHLERSDQFSLEDALGRLTEQVAAMCTMCDIPRRLGFEVH
ncbi:hypothetical protein OG618_36575 [Kitasatospora sp. NBC_01246]|uniref:hypothetical protein n=1 Tax=Kitasatospora sp. NBC_01246 TaxID=2903570 RepID=UPI002E37C8AE|nr:hypothetical protein [Kitasatospora sp. NBC_01246]